MEKEKKLEVITQHLNDDQFVLLHFNPGEEGVDIPEQFASSPSLTLKFSYYFAGETILTEDEISADLLFGNQLYNCRIPLKSIWGCTSENKKNYVWPESIKTSNYEELSGSIAAIKANKPGLNLTTNPEQDKAENLSEDSKSSPSTNKIKKCSLKLIK